MIRTYSELISIPNFMDRFRYLNLKGKPGEITFGSKRYLNQVFYKSARWKSIRRQVVTRDCGHDLAHDDFPIQGKILVHHLNPLTESDILNETEFLVNPEYLVCVSDTTHNAIHYGDEGLLSGYTFVERHEGDTIPWIT